MPSARFSARTTSADAEPLQQRCWAGSEPHLASGLLQHQDKELVDEHYNLASSLEVVDLFGQWIENSAGS